MQTSTKETISAEAPAMSPEIASLVRFRLNEAPHVKESIERVVRAKREAEKLQADAKTASREAHKAAIAVVEAEINEVDKKTIANLRREAEERSEAAADLRDRARLYAEHLKGDAPPSIDRDVIREAATEALEAAAPRIVAAHHELAFHVRECLRLDREIKAAHGACSRIDQQMRWYGLNPPSEPIRWNSLREAFYQLNGWLDRAVAFGIIEEK